MEEALELTDFLPVSFKSPSERDYIGFLWEVFDANYASGKYQFAFLAYHMLTMSFVYFKVWQIKLARQHDFEKGLIGFARTEGDFLKATSPFDFSVESESSILRLFRLLDCDSSKIGRYAALIKDRNNSAHSNGQIYFRTEEGLATKVNEVLRIAREIQTHSRPVIEELYSDFLVSSTDPDKREYTDNFDQIREALVHVNYFSLRDIGICLKFDLGPLLHHPEIGRIEELHMDLEQLYFDVPE